MSLASHYGTGRFGLSFELFPPKTDAGVDELFANVGRLMAYEPQYLTCTYGAGGSTQGRTLEICRRVRDEYRVPVASHLTVVGSTEAQLRQYLAQAREGGVDYIVALRGDPPKGQDGFRPTEGGLRYANELVALIRGEFPEFGIAVAGYPETHQEATDGPTDLTNLRRKVDAGADIVITQLFYDNDDFFAFRDRCEAAGITVPIVPGILPVTSLSQIRRIAGLCKAGLPIGLCDRLAEQDDAAWQTDVGVDWAIRQVQALIDGGVPGVHFYVLNRSEATSRVLQAVSVRA